MNANRVRLIAIACAFAGCSVFQGCEFFDKDKNRCPPPPPARLDPLPPETEPEIPPAIDEGFKPAPGTLTAPVRPETRTYTVVKGDTLSEIARREGVRVQDVRAMNPSIDPNRLSIGQGIALPPGKGAPGETKAATTSVPVVYTTPAANGVKPLPPPAATPAKDGKSVSYTVANGDSLSVIATRFGVKVEEIRTANKLKGDTIRVGQKLTIPAPTKAYAAPGADTPVKPQPPKNGATEKPIVKDPVKKPDAAAKIVPPPPDPEAMLIPQPPVIDKTVPVIGPAGGADAPQKFTTYTVKEGEDIVSIALRWGVSFVDLKVINNINESKVPAGTTIKIPISE